jgi:hypothetical protein
VRGTTRDSTSRSAPAVENTGVWDEIDIAPADDPLPLLADGTIVDVAITECRVRRIFDGSWRAALTCEVLENGTPHVLRTADGAPIPMRLPLYFKLPPRRGAAGPFQAARAASKFYRTWVVANRGQKPSRRDRMPLAIFRDRLFRARTRVVTKDHRGTVLPVALHHSVVDELL